MSAAAYGFRQEELFSLCVEALCVFECPSFAANMINDGVTIFSSSKMLIDMINRRVHPHLEVHGFLDEIWRMSYSFTFVAFHYIFKGWNNHCS